MVRYALLFPGQASQQVGMGADFARTSPAARALFEIADRETKLPLSRVIAEGPLEQLTDTRFAQPAVVAASLASLRVLREQLDCLAIGPPTFCAGHSVGELAALAPASGADELTILKLVAARAQLMAECCERVDGTMAAVVGLAEPNVAALCRQARDTTGQIVEIANLNAPEQIVVSGHRHAVDWLHEAAPLHGARRVIPLKVGGPFHSSYMRPAAEAFAARLAEADLRCPDLPIVLNQTGRATRDVHEIRSELSGQITAPVRWADSLQTMFEAGCSLFLEVGPGQVLAGLVRRTLPEARVL